MDQVVRNEVHCLLQCFVVFLDCGGHTECFLDEAVVRLLGTLSGVSSGVVPVFSVVLSELGS